MQLTILCLCILLVRPSVWGMLIPFERSNDYRTISLKPQTVVKTYEDMLSNSVSSEIYNASKNGTEDSEMFSGDTTLRTDENNSTLSSGNQSISPSYSTSASSITSDMHSIDTLTTFFNNESHSQSSKEFSSNESSAATSEGTMPGVKSSLLTTPPNNETIATTLTTDDDEPEGVARGKPSTTANISIVTQPKTLYEKSLALLGDPYTVSILIPVIAGVVFATAIILTIATCRCIKRIWTRRRLRRKILPDSVKNLRPSDRARLLAESSDEEF